MFVHLIFVYLVLQTSLCQPTVEFYDGLKNGATKRTVDISSQFETVTVNVNVSNKNTKRGGQPTEFYLVAIPAEKHDHLAYITAKKSSQPPFSVERVLVNGHDNDNIVFYKVNWAPMKPKTWRIIDIKMEFTHVLQPLPAEIKQQDPQLIKYFGDAYFFSPYGTTSIKTHFKLSSVKVESYTRTPKPISKSGKGIAAGEYQNVNAYDSAPIEVHYENNTPFITMTNVIREIEVSHWGRVSVTELYQIVNSGSRLVGEFSTFDHQRFQKGKASFRQLTAQLPKSVENVYFRDRIGNISSSNLRKGFDTAVLQLDQRYTLYGGWSSDFEVGYQLPSEECVKIDGTDKTNHILDLPFSIPFQGAVVDNLTVNVILPEGTTNIEAFVAFPTDAQWTESRKTYLDFTGRPVQAFNKKNVVSYHQQSFKINYRFTQWGIFLEPFYLFVIFFIGFSLYMGFSRLNLQIVPTGMEVIPKGSGEKLSHADDTIKITSNKGSKLAEEILQLFDSLKSSYGSAMQEGGKVSKKSDKLFSKQKDTLDRLEECEPQTAKLCTSIRKAMRSMKEAAKKQKNSKYDGAIRTLEELFATLKSAT